MSTIALTLNFSRVSLHFAADGAVSYTGLYESPSGMIEMDLAPQVAEMFIEQVERARKGKESPLPAPEEVPTQMPESYWEEDISPQEAHPGAVAETPEGTRVFRPNLDLSYVPPASVAPPAPVAPPVEEPPKLQPSELPEGVAVPLAQVDISRVPRGTPPPLKVDMDSAGNPVRQDVTGPSLEGIRAPGDFDTDGLAAL